MGFRIFTWWTGSTFGTWLFTRRNGKEVGRDGDGNVYYENAKGKRWVVYAGDNEASRVPPDWHNWLRHTVAVVPDKMALPHRVWLKPWRPNPTGTAKSEVPPGALSAGGKRSAAAADYRPWSPDEAA